MRKTVHQSVLLHEILEQGLPKVIPENFVYLDGTLGGAGHALAISKKLKGKLTVVGFDQDETAIESAEQTLQGQAEKVILHTENFRNLDKALLTDGIAKVDCIVLDLGLSSDELENSGKGFTFQKDEPLYMTFGDPKKAPFTAIDIVNDWDEQVLADIFFGYSEERYARRVARAIVNYRTKKKIETSMELAEIVKHSIPFRNGPGRKIHPATKTFQALRIAVNDELNALKEGITKGFEYLNSGGRMSVISFHSLEDKIVKEFFKKQVETANILTKKPITACDQELAENPRSRSAKLRIIEKK